MFFNVSTVFSQGINTVINGWGYYGSYSDSLDSLITSPYVDSLNQLGFRYGGVTFYLCVDCFNVMFSKDFTTFIVPDTLSVEALFIEGAEDIEDIFLFLTVYDSSGSWVSLGVGYPIPLNHQWKKFYWDMSEVKLFGVFSISKVVFSFQVEMPGTGYTYANTMLRNLTSIDDTMGVHIIDPFIGPNGIRDLIQNLKELSLSQNYPNPFNPSTVISWQLPVSSFVTLKVYDILGREAATLVNEEKPAGNYEVEFNGADLSTGIYFYQLQANDYIEIKKMILVK